MPVSILLEGEPIAAPRPGPDEVHLYSTSYANGLTTTQVATLTALLSPIEATRATRLRDEGRRTAFICGRALLRTALSRYTPAVPPAAWSIDTGARGTPRLVGTGRLQAISISHCHGRSLVAIAPNTTHVGCDIESIDTTKDPETIASEFFHHAEARTLHTLDGSAQTEEFLRLWTLKESYAKAINLDLAAALKRSLPEADPRWHFLAEALDERHRIAVATRHQTPVPRLRTTVTEMTISETGHLAPNEALGTTTLHGQ